MALRGRTSNRGECHSANSGSNQGVVMNEIVRGLQIESEVAKTLLANIRAVIGDDEQAAADAIEGETNLDLALSAALERVSEIETMIAAIKAREASLKERRDRLDRQASLIRTAMGEALEQAGLKRMELPEATLSLRPLPQKALVIDEASIPSQFWKRADPKLDLRALAMALKEGPVPGATLSNGGQTVQIRMG